MGRQAGDRRRGGGRRGWHQLGTRPGGEQAEGRKAKPGGETWALSQKLLQRSVKLRSKEPSLNCEPLSSKLSSRRYSACTPCRGSLTPRSVLNSSERRS